MKIYRCPECGNLILMLNDSGVNPVCCGQKMQLLVPNRTDGATEKHLPVIEKTATGVRVQVGSTPHPMTPEHFITWIALTDGVTVELKHLKPGDAPTAQFSLTSDHLTAYSYCNLHGLWQSEL